MEKSKKHTWIDTTVRLPAPGVVFVHSARPEKHYTVLQIEGENVYRVDGDDGKKLWGTIDDWRDEIRRRTIQIVHTPNR